MILSVPLLNEAFLMGHSIIIPSLVVGFLCFTALVCLLLITSRIVKLFLSVWPSSDSDDVSSYSDTSN